MGGRETRSGPWGWRKRGYSRDSSGQRDGVRYAVRLIGRGLLSHLSSLARLSSTGGAKRTARDTPEKFHANPFDRRGEMFDNRILFFFLENVCSNRESEDLASKPSIEKINDERCAKFSINDVVFAAETRRISIDFERSQREGPNYLSNAPTTEEIRWKRWHQSWWHRLHS